MASDQPKNGKPSIDTNRGLPILAGQMGDLAPPWQQRLSTEPTNTSQLGEQEPDALHTLRTTRPRDGTRTASVDKPFPPTHHDDIVLVK